MREIADNSPLLHEHRVSISSIDADGDGVITQQEVKAYAQRKFGEAFRGAIGLMPNSVGGHLGNIVLGGAGLLYGLYGAEKFGMDAETANKFTVAGMAMVGTGLAGITASIGKRFVGKPPEPLLPVSSCNNINKRA